MKRLLLIPCAALLIGMLPNVASARSRFFLGLNFGSPYDSFSLGFGGRHGTSFGFSLAVPPPAYYSYAPPVYYSPPVYAPPTYYSAPAYAPPTYYAAPAYAPPTYYAAPAYTPPTYYAPAPVYVPSTYFYYNSNYSYPRGHDRDGGYYHYRH